MATSAVQQNFDSTGMIATEPLDFRQAENALVDKYIRLYGNDSLCYLSYAKEKRYFFGWKSEGLIAYVVIKKVALCLGDPICKPEQFPIFLEEFQRFCLSQKWRVCFSSISQKSMHLFSNCGLKLMKYGEEAVIELPTYELVGKKTMKLRNKIHQAENNGLRVMEYQPMRQRDLALERKIDQVSAEWFADKNAQLTFSLGDLQLDTPLNRRYFVSLDAEQNVHAILMFSPYRQGNAYFLDVMRRKKQETLPGAMEHAIIHAAMQMRSEGVEEVSLGLVPLVGIEKEVQNRMLQKIAQFVFCHVKSEYGFESLYHYKKKFSPTRWDSRYIAYEKTIPMYKVWLVMIKARNVKGAFQQVANGIWSLMKRKPAKHN